MPATLRGVAAVGFAGQWVVDIADGAEGGHGADRVDDRGRGIQAQEHVADFDALEAANGGAVKTQPFIDRLVGIELFYGHGEVMPLAEQIGELDIHHLNVVVHDGAVQIGNCTYVEFHSSVNPFTDVVGSVLIAANRTAGAAVLKKKT